MEELCLALIRAREEPRVNLFAVITGGQHYSLIRAREEPRVNLPVVVR